ncbi:MAG TPA: TonB family protein [Thermoanaerobaculia bacterium]|nr:TonB family protein [Thermoanaerobaculia bacterium]
MHDPVGDILRERAALDRSAATGVAFSLLLHTAMTAAAVWGTLHARPAQTAGVINIRLARLPAPAAVAQKQPPRAASAPPATIQEPQPAVEQPKPRGKAAEKNTVPLSPFGRSPKKGSENPAAPPAAAPVLQKPGTSSTAEVPVGEAGVTALEGGDFPYTFYIERMKNLIGNRWVRPPVGAGTATTVRFVIERDGTIRDVQTEVASGNGSFDRAAVRAVLEASPLPPLPFGYSGTYLGVHLTFK